MNWHVLDTRSIWLKEFAAALNEERRVKCWHPDYRRLGLLENWEREETHPDPSLQLTRFPLQRGYSNRWIEKLFAVGKSVADRIAASSPTAREDVLICTAPYYAPVAEFWQGPVVYYLTDLTKFYAGADLSRVVALDRRMCKVAHAICPNSQRIADYLISDAGCDTSRISVVPNATRLENILSAPSLAPQAPPLDIADLPRPLVGIVGNLASNVDWELIESCIQRTPEFSWVFVGPHEMAAGSASEEMSRTRVLNMKGRVRFLGSRPYAVLKDYARSFDVAFIPYRSAEPTISGSATRFYEHLAACRPIIASRAHYELRRKEQLLKLVGNAEEFRIAIDHLQHSQFRDGVEELRWQVSRKETWHSRAQQICSFVASRPRLKLENRSIAPAAGKLEMIRPEMRD